MSRTLLQEVLREEGWGGGAVDFGSGQAFRVERASGAINLVDSGKGMR